jgi:hypothetical protein
MNARALELASRRGALRERIEVQRAALAVHTVGLSTACARGDAVLRGVDWLKQHPLAVGAAVLVVVLARPRRAWRWGGRALFLWRGWRSVRNILSPGR